MRAIDKVHELRKSIHIRSSAPRRAYMNRIRRPKKILKIIEEKNPATSILYEARRAYVVSLACAFEIFWRELVKSSIDDANIDQTKLQGLESIKMSMRELAGVFRHNMTLGELISCSFSFQGVEQVNKAISVLLGIDAFSEYRTYKFQFYTVDSETKDFVALVPTCFGPEALKRSKFINQCFEIRHDSVHNTGTRFRVKPDLIHRMEDALWLFNLTFGIFAEKKFTELITKSYT